MSAPGKEAAPPSLGEAFAPHQAQALEYLGTKRELRPPKKHGLMPL